MPKSRSLQQAVRFALATATAAAGVSTLHAQVAPAPAPAPVEEVVVTGSRLLTPNEASISPITTVSATDLQATGLNRVEDVLNNLPMVFAGQNSTVSNGSDGTGTVDLRGLGPQRTLVLINGRRLCTLTRGQVRLLGLQPEPLQGQARVRWLGDLARRLLHQLQSLQYALHRRPGDRAVPAVRDKRADE